MSDRTLLEALRTLKRDVSLLKRRRSGGGGGALPERLSPIGQEVRDWDTDANEVGFYWSDNTAVNGPPPGHWYSGIVTATWDRITQEVSRDTNLPSNFRETWRRVSIAGAPGTFSDWERMDGTQSGTVNIAQIVNGASVTGTRNFPRSYATAPSVMLTPNNGRHGIQLTSVTPTGFTFLVANFSGGTANASKIWWQAVPV